MLKVGRATAAAARPRQLRGFTLIELLTTFVVLGILVSLALPSFSIWIGNAQIRTVADSLQNGIRLAQAEAVRRNRQVVLSFTNATPGLNAAAVAGGKSWSLQTVQQFSAGDSEFIQGGAFTDIASSVTIASVGTPLTALCFNSSGRMVVNAAPGPANSACIAANASFEINRNISDRRLRVLVGVGGQIRLCDPGRPTLSSDSPDGCPV